MLVKIFDLIAMAKKLCTVSRPAESRYTITNLQALIVGERKCILTDSDAIHTIHDRGQGEYFGLRIGRLEPEVLPSGCILEKEGTLQILFEVFLNETPLREQELQEFIRTGKDRVERNYRLLLDSIRSIGIDPEPYSRQGV